ncbi:MAG: VanW family protein [Candidatus Curtissbacteria bacterium]|nr:VanW family protein [Candidatus Curtissbacteria bacterium]
MAKLGLKQRKSTFFALLGLAVFFIYNFTYLDKILPNTYIGTQNLGGKDRVSAFGLISKSLDDFDNSPIIFEINGKTLEVKPAEVGISLDSEKTLNSVYNGGRTADFYENLKQKIGAIFLKTQLTPYYRLDFNQFANFLDSKFSEIEKQPRDATIAYQDGHLAILPQQTGTVVDRGKLTADIVQRVESLQSSPIEVMLIDASPKIDAQAASKAFSKVQVLVNSKITLTYGYGAWRLGDSDLLKILRFYPLGHEKGYVEEVKFGGNKITFSDISLVDSDAPILNVVVDEKMLDGFLGKITADVDRPTVDATLKFANGKVSEFSPAIDGQKVNVEATRKLILSKVSVDDLNSEGDIQIPLPVAVTRARTDSSEINSYGIRELIGRGISYFAGSIANRVNNIGLGASRVSGTIVAPGDIFSFNKTVGEVSAATGFRQAYIISGGRTVLDDGGGICQVSTTLFRAALNSGLPIVSRTAHAYRVGYYEQGGFKPGLDATVWSPGVDFAFKNDTSHYILVQAVMDPANSKLEIDIYGTLDGRKVDVSDPVITNIKPAPEDKYQDDPTLPKGVIKQVDFSAQGADSLFTRKVYKDDKLISDDVFKSYYRPWQAVYLVGT